MTPIPLRVLVTGGDGFVGKRLVSCLRKMGHIVVNADKKSGVNLANLDVARAMIGERPEIIFHLASSCSTPGSVKDPSSTFTDTVVTAANILEAARPGKIPVILTSSVKARDGMTPYGAAKQMVETWAREYRLAYGIPVVTNRPGTIYGPGQEGSEESGWIAWFCKARDESLEVTINGDGTQVRDLLHVDDYVALMLHQARHVYDFNGRTFDVGGGEENAVTVNQMASHLGLKVKHGPSRYGDSPVYIAYNDVPGWAPRMHWWESETLG